MRFSGRFSFKILKVKSPETSSAQDAKIMSSCEDSRGNGFYVSPTSLNVLNMSAPVLGGQEEKLKFFPLAA